MRAPLLATLALTTSAKLSPEWRVVAENRGVVTRARIDEASQLCAVHGEAVVELSMAELMTVFLDLEQYDKWDDTLVEKRQWRADGADFIYQRFQQPWPVRDRELVLRFFAMARTQPAGFYLPAKSWMNDEMRGNQARAP